MEVIATSEQRLVGHVSILNDIAGSSEYSCDVTVLQVNLGENDGFSEAASYIWRRSFPRCLRERVDTALVQLRGYSEQVEMECFVVLPNGECT